MSLKFYRICLCIVLAMLLIAGCTPGPTDQPTETTAPAATMPLATGPLATDPMETEPAITEPAGTLTTEPATEPEDEIYTEVDEMLYVAQNTNVHLGPGTEYDCVGVLTKGTTIKCVAIGSNGWNKVIFKGELCYVSSSCLVKEMPRPTEPPTEPPKGTEPATKPPVTEPPVTEPPATEPPATEPPATEPPATEPPVTEPPVTEPPATEAVTCAHNWQTVSHPEVGHYEGYAVCKCGYRCKSTDGWIAHVNNYSAEEALLNHTSYGVIEDYIIDSPASTEWVCSKCGKTTTTQP